GGAATAAAAGADDASGRRTAISPPHTEQRARTPRSGTLAGSTRNTVAHCGQETFIASSLASRITATGAAADLVIASPAIGHEHRTRQRLGVTLHLGGQFTHFRGMREAAVLVGDDADRQRHQRHPVQLAPAIL